LYPPGTETLTLLIITTNALFTIFGVYLLIRELARENGLTKKKFAAMTRLSKILSKKKLVFKDNELIGFNKKNGGATGEQKNTSNKKQEKEVEMTDMQENPNWRPRSKSLATAAVFEGAAVHSNPLTMRLANPEEKNTATNHSSQDSRSSKNAFGRKYTKKEPKKKRNRIKRIKLASKQASKPKAATIIEMSTIELEPQETSSLASISNPMHKTSEDGTTVETKVVHVERPTTHEVFLDENTGRRYSIDSGTQQSNWIDEVDVVQPNHDIFLDASSGRRYSIDRDTQESNWVDEGDY
jgi:hypothetical protein